MSLLLLKYNYFREFGNILRIISKKTYIFTCFRSSIYSKKGYNAVLSQKDNFAISES